ncbi:MAG: hypothetical protein AAF998_25790 [Bacteroidota bacterium]
MALNHILYRPQTLDRPVRSQKERLTDEAMELFMRLIADAASGGRAIEIAREAIIEMFETLAQDFESRLEDTAKAAQEFFKPIVDAVEGLSEDIENAESSAENLKTGGKLFALLADALEAMAPDEIEVQMNNFGKIVTDNLGLTKERMTGLFEDLIDVLIDKFKADFLGGDKSENAHNAYLIGAYLEKLRGYLDETLETLNIDIDLSFLTKQIVNFFRNPKWNEIRAKIAYYLDESGKTVNLIGELMNIFSAEFNGEVSVSASASLGGPGSAVPGPEPACGDDVEDPISWYLTYWNNFFGWSIPVGVASRAGFNLEDDYKDIISFGRKSLTPKLMEEIAWNSDWIQDVVEAGLHAISLEKKDVASNITHGLLKILRALLKRLLGNNEDTSWVKFYQVYGMRYVEIAVKFLTAWLTGLEGYHKCQGEKENIFYLTLVGADFAENMLYSNWGSRLRQFLLSLLTLLNSDVTAKPKSENHDRIAGLCNLVVEGFLWISASISGRQNYGIPREGAWYWLHQFLISVGFALTGVTAGWGIGWAIAHGEQKEGVEASKTMPSAGLTAWLLLEASVAGVLRHAIYNYFIWNNNTKDGTIGQETTVDPPIWHEDFKGIGNKSTSPYLLPYKRGDYRQCAQGHLGVWSHNANTEQIYAYDWDHDQDMEVLSVREGTVRSWADTLPDHTTVDDNNILVNHNLTPPHPGHDRDWRDDPVMTFANYLHGAHFGVRHCFALIGVPADFITGTVITQGQLIMLAGDTGRSFYNHLHMHVSTGSAKSVPWVFRDEDAPDDGVLRDLNWYRSDNRRIPDPVYFRVGHPQELMTFDLGQITIISGSTTTSSRGRPNNYTTGVGLRRDKDNVDDCENLWNGLVIENPLAGGGFEYTEISSYRWSDGSSDAAITYDPPLNNRPAVGDNLRFWSRASGVGANTLDLDPLANTHRDDEYPGRFIHVEWVDGDGVTRHQYKRISSYDCDKRRVTIEGTWDLLPSRFSKYEIGGKLYSQSLGFYQKFAFISKNPADTPDIPIWEENTPPALIANIAYLNAQGQVGDIVQADSAAATTNEIRLSTNAPSDVSAVINRFIAITTQGATEPENIVVAYGFVTGYNLATQTVTIDGTWGLTIPAADHHYYLGEVNYAVANDDQRAETAFICPDSTPDEYTPIDFDTGAEGPLYISLTYDVNP